MTLTQIKPTIAVHTHDPSKDSLPVRSLEEIEAFWISLGGDHTEPETIAAAYGRSRYFGAEPLEILLPELNVEALKVVYEFARNEGDQGVRWDQGTWGKGAGKGDLWDGDDALFVSCGTSCCLAGWTAHATGATMLGWQGWGDAVYIEHVVDPRTSEVNKVWTFAREQLGLHDYESDLLFGGENGLSQVEDFIHLFFYVRGLEAPDWLG